jgi:hypothetical protein
MYHKKLTHFYKSLYVHKDKKVDPFCYKTNLNISLLLNSWFQTHKVKNKNKTNKHLVYSFEPKIAEFVMAHNNIENREKC